MKKILIGYIISSNNSGINRYLYNLMDVIKDDFEIEVLTSDYSKELERKLKSYNARLLVINRLSSPVKRYKQTKKIIKENKYDIIYFNISESFNCICNIAAKRFSNSVIITHSHSSYCNTSNKIVEFIKVNLNSICRIIIKKCSDYYYSCSTEAGLWLFGKKIVENNKKYRVIRNTVNVDTFSFNNNSRDSIRMQYNIEKNSKVVGFVGGLLYQKNILFLVDLFLEIYKLNNNCKFFIIGEGPMREVIEDKIKNKNMENEIILTGKVSNVSEYMSAMDVFVLPSFFEGLPMVGVEAQVNGLECFFSDSITYEVAISDAAHFISLKKDAKMWATEINPFLQKNRKVYHKYYDLVFDNKLQKKEFYDIFIKQNFI